MSARVSRCPDRPGVCRADGIGARGGSRRRDRGAAGVGQEALPQELFAVPRREGGRRRLRRPASAPQAPQLHDGQVQGSDDSQRSAPDAIRISSTSSGAACPTPRCPPGPTLSDQEVSDLAYFITTFSPDFSNPENVPQPVPLPSAPAATKESIELGKKLYVDTGCVKCHGKLGRGDGPSAPTLKDDLGHPIRAANLAQTLDLPRRVVSRGYLPDDEHGAQRHAHAVVRRRAHARATMGDHGLHRLSLGDQRAWLYQPRRRQARPGSDRSGEGGRELRIRSRGSLSDRRADHGARTLVPSSRDLRDRSGDLRCRVDRPSRSMARHERGEDGEERPVASRAAGGGGGSRRRRPAGAQRTSADALRRRGAAPATLPQKPAQRTPLPSRKRRQPPSHPSSPTPSRSRFLRRCRPAPASPTSSSATPRTRWISGSSIWPAPIPFSSPAGEARTSRPTTRGISPVSRATTRENGRSSSSGRFAQPRAPRSRPESSCRSPSRSGTGSRASVATGEVSRSGTPSTSSRKWSHRPSARW